VLIDLLAIVAGITVWGGSSFGRKASLIIQFIQLPKITSPPIIFLFSFGLDLWVHASSSGDVGFQISVFFNQFFLNVPNAPVDFGISITAIIALVILKKYQPPSRMAGTLPPPPPTNWLESDQRYPTNSYRDESPRVGMRLAKTLFGTFECGDSSLRPWTALPKPPIHHRHKVRRDHDGRYRSFPPFPEP